MSENQLLNGYANGITPNGFGLGEGGLVGIKSRLLGLQKGRSGLVLYWGGVATMIAIKIDNNEQSPSQRDWQLAVEIQGFKYYVIRSLQEFQILINTIIHA